MLNNFPTFKKNFFLATKSTLKFLKFFQKIKSPCTKNENNLNSELYTKNSLLYIQSKINEISNDYELVYSSYLRLKYFQGAHLDF